MKKIIPTTDGARMNQFLKKMAAAEKLATMKTAEEFFAQRKGHGNLKQALALLSRKGGEPPRADDRLPN